MKLSIIIVYFEGRDNLRRLLSSVYKYTIKHTFEVIVVNNNPNNEIYHSLKKVFPKVIYIKNKTNVGYGEGNNIGASTAIGEYLFIVNPDIELESNSLNILIEFLDRHENAAIVAPNQIHKSGALFENIGTLTLTPLRGIVALSFINNIFPGNSISRSYYLKDVQKNKLRKTGTVPGSAFLIRKKVFEKAGSFDKNIFLYFEEMDLGKRTIDLGYDVSINPSSTVVHHRVENRLNNNLKKYYLESRFYYFKKHYGRLPAIAVELFGRMSRLKFAVLFIVVIFWVILKFFR